MQRVANNLEDIQRRYCVSESVLAVLIVMKTCEGCFMAPEIPFNETVKNFIPSNFTCEMWLNEMTAEDHKTSL